MQKLFQPYDLAGLRLPNRVVMAPMTRSRSPSTIPDAQTALYYAQRASAGLIISEGIPVSQEGTGFLFNPSLFTSAQAAGWAPVTDAVHAQGGRIFAQLWHVGRLSHVSLQEHGAAPIGPVARRAESASAYAWVEPGVAGSVAASVPRAIPAGEIPRVVDDFVRSARMAIAAGFDGIELHGANGYLFEQFLNGELNTRTDAYGGAIDNRMRLLLDTVDALVAEVGAHRVGVRISPFGRLYDMQPFADERETWLAVAAALDARHLAYVHTSDQLVMGCEAIPASFVTAFRAAYRGTLISAGGFEQASAERALQDDQLDLVAFGRPFIANPDLVARMEHGWPLATADRATFYGLHGARGYTDYTTYPSSTKEAS